MITQDQLSMVAIPSMNDTHLEDMILINKLSKAVQNKDIVLTSTTLAEFIKHTIVHFSGEEEMMEEKKFPSYSDHKAQHDRILHELKSVEKRFNEENDFLLVSAYVDGSLSPWLIHHVQTLDTQMALFIKDSI